MRLKDSATKDFYGIHPDYDLVLPNKILENIALQTLLSTTFSVY